MKNTSMPESKNKIFYIFVENAETRNEGYAEKERKKWESYRASVIRNAHLYNSHIVPNINELKFRPLSGVDCANI